MSKKLYCGICDFCDGCFTTTDHNAHYCPRCAFVRKVLHIVRKRILLPLSYVLYDFTHPSEVLADWHKARV